MLRTRVMPCLLLRNGALVKTVRFTKPAYVGDPINTVRIFNEKEVDELVLLDISASPGGAEPNYKLIAEVASECFMPLTYGGGIRNLAAVEKLFALGAEKVVVNTHAAERPTFITEIAREFGSQSVIVSIDVARAWFGRSRVVTRSRSTRVAEAPVDYARRCEELGAGELLLTAVDRDGTFKGYDLELIREVSHAVGVPLIASGGAGRVEDFALAVDAGASAVAAGSLVVYQGVHRSVLINFPTRSTLKQVLT